MEAVGIQESPRKSTQDAMVQFSLSSPSRLGDLDTNNRSVSMKIRLVSVVHRVSVIHIVSVKIRPMSVHLDQADFMRSFLGASGTHGAEARRPSIPPEVGQYFTLVVSR